jgi:hypothetical protein
MYPKGETQGRVSSTCVSRDATDAHGTKWRPNKQTDSLKSNFGFYNHAVTRFTQRSGKKCGLVDHSNSGFGSGTMYGLNR